MLDALGHLEGCQDGVESNEVLVLDLRKTQAFIIQDLPSTITFSKLCNLEILSLPETDLFTLSFQDLLQEVQCWQPHSSLEVPCSSMFHIFALLFFPLCSQDIAARADAHLRQAQRNAVEAVALGWVAPSCKSYSNTSNTA